MTHPLQTLVRQLGRAAARNGLAQLGDAELLRRFTADRDPLAFEALVWRHGMMVLDVCRRVSGRCGDAEDAFQATFLMLIRRAPSVRSGESLAGWLYRVARRLGIRASRQRAHQTQREMRVARAETVIDDRFERSDWRAVLDRELERLPSRYREAFILCHLEGRGHEDAARELGCPLGTLHSRLARAKERLRVRLGVAGAGFPVVASVLVSPSLVNATVTAAIEFANGSTLAASTSAGAISYGGWNLMGLVNVKCLVAVVLAVATIGSGAVFLNQPVVRATPAPVAPADPTIEELKRENQRLRQEVAELKKRLAEFDCKRLAQDELPPTDQDVLRAMRKGEKDLGEISALTITKSRILDQLGPPRFYPLVGLAQLRSEHWKCTVHFESETRDAKKIARVQVVYIDRDTLITTADQPK